VLHEGSSASMPRKHVDGWRLGKLDTTFQIRLGCAAPPTLMHCHRCALIEFPFHSTLCIFSQPNKVNFPIAPHCGVAVSLRCTSQLRTPPAWETSDSQIALTERERTQSKQLAPTLDPAFMDTRNGCPRYASRRCELQRAGPIAMLVCSCGTRY
jgi:hypothetical protein